MDSQNVSVNSVENAKNEVVAPHSEAVVPQTPVLHSHKWRQLMAAIRGCGDVLDPGDLSSMFTDEEDEGDCLISEEEEEKSSLPDTQRERRGVLMEEIREHYLDAARRVLLHDIRMTSEFASDHAIDEMRPSCVIDPTPVEHYVLKDFMSGDDQLIFLVHGDGSYDVSDSNTGTPFSSRRPSLDDHVPEVDAGLQAVLDGMELYEATHPEMEVFLPSNEPGYLIPCMLDVMYRSTPLPNASFEDQKVDFSVPTLALPNRRKAWDNAIVGNVKYLGELARFWWKGEISLSTAVRATGVALYDLGWLLKPWVLLFSLCLTYFWGIAYMYLCSWLIATGLVRAWREGLTPVVILALSFEAFSIAVGFPFGMYLFIGLLPALGEERLKRYLNYHFGGLSVILFGFVEMAIYLHIFGSGIIVIRLMVVSLHVFWAMLPERWGELLHALHNSSGLFLFQLGVRQFTVGNFLVLYNPEFMEIFDRTANNLGAIAVAAISIAVAMALLFCLKLNDATPARITDAVGQARRTSVHDYRVRGNKLYREKVEVKRFPPLHAFVEWESAKEVGLVDLMALCEGWSPDTLQLYYLACIVYMQQKGVAGLRKALTLGIVSMREHSSRFSDSARRLALLRKYHDLINDATPQATMGTSMFAEERAQLGVLKAYGKPGSVLARIVWLASKQTAIYEWVICFSREIVEFGFDEGVLSWMADNSIDAHRMFAEWLCPSPNQPQTIGEFIDSPLYIAFMKLVQNLIISSFLEESLGLEVFTVKKFTSFAEFLRDAVKFFIMGKDAIVCWLTGKRSSVFLSSFAGTEAEVDELLKLPLPDVSDLEFTRKREERLAALEGMAEGLRILSAGKPELTQRHANIKARVAEVRRLAFSDQVGEEPVVIMMLGSAGLGKSMILQEINRAALTQAELVPTGGIPEHLTHILRNMGNKHIDAMPNPQAIKSVIMDDFQQVVSVLEARVAELAMFHAMACAEAVALPFAALEGKAQSTQLQPLFLYLATNRQQEVFAGAREFNRKSLARRVDLAVDVFPIREGEIFSASNPPGRYSIMFQFSHLEYRDEGKDEPVRIPQMLDGVYRTNDRVQAVGLIVKYAVRLRARKNEMIAKRKGGVKCKATGWNIDQHYGAKCCNNCDFDVLDAEVVNSDQFFIVKRREDSQAWDQVPFEYFEKCTGEWKTSKRLELNVGGKLYAVDEDVIRANRKGLFDKFGPAPAEDRTAIPQSASPVVVNYVGAVGIALSALLLPNAWRFLVVCCMFIFLLGVFVANTTNYSRVKLYSFVLYKELIPEWISLFVVSAEDVRTSRMRQIRDFGSKLAPQGNAMMKHIRGVVHLRVKEKIEMQVVQALALSGVTLSLALAYYFFRRSHNDPTPQVGASNMPSGDNKMIKCDPDLRKQVLRTYRRVPQGQWSQVLPVMFGAVAHVSVGKGLDLDVKMFALVSGNRAFIVSHGYRPSMNFRPLINTGDEEKGQRLRLTYVEGAQGQVRFAGTDVMRVELGENPRRNVDPHFISMEVLRTVVGEAFLLHNNVAVAVTILRRVENYHFNDGTPGGIIITEAFEYELPFDTYVGLCGCPVVGKSSNGCLFLIGIHHAGRETNKRHGLGQYLPEEYLSDTSVPTTQVLKDAVAQRLDVVAQSSLTPLWAFDRSVVCAGLVQPDTVPRGWPVGKEFGLDEAKESGITNYLGISAVKVGTLPGPQRRLKGTLRPSVLEKEFPEGGTEFFAPAWMKDVQVDGVWKGPYSKLAEAIAKDVRIDPDALEKALADLRVSDEAVLGEMHGMTPLSIRQAVHGVPGFMNPMNLGTSAGFGREGRQKKEFITKVGEDVVIDPCLLSEITTLVEEPDIYDLPVEGCEKAEVRPIAKASSTRFFTIFPAAFLCVARMFLSIIMAIWRQDAKRAETMIGQNAAGKAWSMLGESLDEEWEYPSWFLAVDFVKYDKSFVSVLKASAYAHVMWMVSATAYTLGQIKVCRCLFGMLMNTFLFLKRDCFHIWDWQHSGDPFTVEINSFGQRILYRYWYYKCMTGATVGTFREWVRLWTYGDDGLARVRRDPRLSVLSFVDAIADWGMEATSSAKGALDECPRDGLSFLKRAIVYDADFNGYRAPLEEASIFKMLCWFDTTSAITEGTWASAVSDNAAAEWFLHGRERFEVETARLKKACEAVGVVYAGREWDEYMERYQNSTFTTWAI